MLPVHHDDDEHEEHDERAQLVPRRHMLTPSRVEAINRSTQSATGALSTDVFTKRWSMLLLSCGIAFVAQAQAAAPFSIVGPLGAFLDVPAMGVHGLAAAVFFASAVLQLPAVGLRGTIGLRWGLLGAAALMAVAALLRFVSALSPNVAWLVLAQVLTGAACATTAGLANVLADRWFPPSERPLATGLSTVFAAMGTSASLFGSPHLIDSDPTKTRFMILWGTHLALALGVLLIASCVVEEAPPLPPHVPSMLRDTSLRAIPSEVAVALSERSFVVAAVPAAFGMGLLRALVVVLSAALSTTAVSETKAGVLACSGIITGTVAFAVVAGLGSRAPHIFRALMALVTVVAACSAASAGGIITAGLDRHTATLALLPTVPIAIAALGLGPIHTHRTSTASMRVASIEPVGSSLYLALFDATTAVLALVLSAILGGFGPAETTAARGAVVFWVAAATLVVSLASLVSGNTGSREEDAEE